MALRRSLVGSLAVPALVLPALLAGCGDDSSVADPPVQSAPDPTPTSDPPAHESAEHFIRRFYAAERRMENTGKTAAYSRLMTERCKPCVGLVQQVRTFYGDGGFIHWGGLRIASINQFSNDSTQGHSYSIKFQATPTKYKQSDSAPLQTLPGGESTDVLTLKASDRSWVVVARARLSS